MIPQLHVPEGEVGDARVYTYVVMRNIRYAYPYEIRTVYAYRILQLLRVDVTGLLYTSRAHRVCELAVPGLYSGRWSARARGLYTYSASNAQSLLYIWRCAVMAIGGETRTR